MTPVDVHMSRLAGLQDSPDHRKRWRPPPCPYRDFGGDDAIAGAHVRLSSRLKTLMLKDDHNV